jgi:hypothetical protein
MVWKFLDLHAARGARKRDAILGQIDRWWHEFRSRTPDLDALFHGRKDWDLPGWIETHLHSINRNLMWEFGEDLDTRRHYMVITPEVRRHLRPLVETIVERAPRLNGWSFHTYRQPEPLEMARETVEVRTGAPLLLGRACVRLGDMNRLDLFYEGPAGDDDALAQAFTLTEGLLGEETLDKWVGFVDVAPEPPGGRWLSLGRLQATVSALITSRIDQLPDRPCRERLDGAAWSRVQAQPGEADDYPGQRDLLSGETMLPDMWQAAHGDRAFYSVRYSRCGERFCYLKMDGRDGGGPASGRAAFEEALNAALVPARAGCVVGSGAGLRYSYIDLALTDVPAAGNLIREVLRARGAPRRSWLLFYDCEWRREWVGIWDETPPPPR